MESSAHEKDVELLKSSESNLTSINNDCKILIFEYLEWPDLISIAETSKLLYTAACDVFERKHGDGRIMLNANDSCRAACNAPDIVLSNGRMELKLLRNFGHIVSHLYFAGSLRIENYPYCWRSTTLLHVEHYVAEYCSKSLRKLTLGLMPISLFGNIQTTFKNVTSITLFKCGFSIGSQFFEIINTFFPNLHTLELCLTQMKEPLGINVGWPSVKHLIIYAIKCGMNSSRGFHFEDDEIIKVLKLNPQLEKLKLHLNGEFSNIWHCLNEYLPMLRCLILHFTEMENNGPFHLDNVVDFVYFYLWTNKPLRNIPFTFSKLERFECPYITRETMNSCILDFIAKNEHLKSIEMGSESDDLNGLFELDVVLNIEELSIHILCEISSEVVLRFLEQNRSLKKLTLWGEPKVFEHFNDRIKLKISKRKMSKGYYSKEHLIFFPRN